ncbi:MAG: class I SAM-dependent methyltransferase [Bacteroidota bacterium]
MSNNHFWDKRYIEEGEIWNRGQSLTANFLSQLVPKDSNIFEIGFGYGRDVIHLAQQGYRVSAIEQSVVGYNMAVTQLREIGIVHSPHLIRDDFLNVALPSNAFDAVCSHRVIHLLDNDSVSKYCNKVANIVRDNGLIFIAARDPRGNKPLRKNHTVSLWDEQRFYNSFSEHFTIDKIIQGEELESASNPVPTYFTLMIAQRKPRMG